MTLSSLLLAFSLWMASPPPVLEMDAPEEEMFIPPVPGHQVHRTRRPDGPCRTPQVQLCQLQPCPAGYPCACQAGHGVPGDIYGLPRPPKVVTNPRSDRPTGIHFAYAGPALIGFTVTHFLTPTIQLEAGLGVLTRFAGVTYHFDGHNPHSRWTPYAGITLGDFHSWDSGMDKYYGVYIPLGFQFSGRGGFTFSVEGAWATVSDGTETYSFPFFGLKVGYRF